MSSNGTRDLRIAIIGAGPGGICMGIKLKQAGFDDFVILEKGDGVGGTWYHNRYPGCECDIASHLYSYSFEIKPDWSKPFGPQPEILDYVQHCATKYGVLPHCQFNAPVRRVTWTDETSMWSVEQESGETIEANIVVSAIGMFNNLVYPDIEGLDSFAGTSFHSARWNWDHKLEGRTVGVVGSAASAVQFVPEIIKQAKQVHLFQRTANWVLPKEDTPYTEEQLRDFQENPELALAIRNEIFNAIESGDAFNNPATRAQMEETVRKEIAKVEDPETRAKLVPDHMWGCKRPLFANTYYPAFNSPNLNLVTEGIERITPNGVVTVDGVERPLDTLVLATGFDATKYLLALDVTGRDGLHIADAWKDGAQAYRGVTTRGFPNLFMLYGPNINMGSLITMIEWQTTHIVKHLEHIVREDLAWVDVRADRMAEYNVKMQEDIEAVVPWNKQSGCNTYYRAPSGRVVTQWPHSMGAYRDTIETPEFDAFESRPR
jgi:cation diffusion facilitator CzcD-associated flavoprotein CzcO